MHLQLFLTFVMGIFLLFSWWVELVRTSQRMAKTKVNTRCCLIYLCPIGWWKVKREQRKETDVKKKQQEHAMKKFKQKTRNVVFLDFFILPELFNERKKFYHPNLQAVVAFLKFVAGFLFVPN